MTESLSPLESELARLPEPEPPAGLTEAVMARVARVDVDRRERAHEAGGEPVRGRGRLAAALGASGLAAYVFGLQQGAWSFNPLASPIVDAVTSLAEGPEWVPGALGLAMVMLLYLAGLLAPLGRGTDPGARTRSQR